jgi:hypothetical protein
LQIPAKATIQASMNTTFARLKTAGLVEDNKTKQLLNEDA